MPLIDGGSGTASKPNVDSNYNLLVNFPMTGTQAGFLTINTETYPSGTLDRDVENPQTSIENRLSIGKATPYFIDRFNDNNSINTALYNSNVSTMTTVQSGGFVNLNANLTTDAGSARLQTYRSFPIIPTYGTSFICYAKLKEIPINNNITEIGLGYATASSTPTDGAFFRLSGTTLSAVTNSNGAEIYATGISTSLIATGITHKFEIDSYARFTTFLIDDTAVANITLPSGTGLSSSAMSQSMSYPVLLRTYNTASASPAQMLSVAGLVVSQIDFNMSKFYDGVMTGMGAISSQGQNGFTVTGTTAQYANNTTPVASTGSNTEAILGTGLGGQFIWSGTITSPTTDYIISSYQNPPATSILPGKTLYINGINMTATNLSGVTTNIVTSAMCACYGHTSESLATAESATSKAPRIIPIGALSIPSASITGYSTPRIVFPFTAPIVVNSSEYFAISAKFLAGSGITNFVHYSIGIDGYWE
jgi:hypothetical protein